MGLRADRVHRPFLSVRQTHILLAVRELGGQQLQGPEIHRLVIQGWIHTDAQLMKTPMKFSTPSVKPQNNSSAVTDQTQINTDLAQVVLCLPKVKVAIQRHGAKLLIRQK